MCAARPALHLPRRVLHLPTPQPPPPQRHGPARHSAAPTAYYPGRPTASPGARSISAISDFQKKRSYIRLISSYQGVSGSYQPNISSKTLYQGLTDISLIYQADTMVVRIVCLAPLAYSIVVCRSPERAASSAASWSRSGALSPSTRSVTLSSWLFMRCNRRRLLLATFR